MKKGLIFMLFALFAMSNVKAQTSIGGGLAVWDDLGVEVKANFGINEQLSISPSFDYLFADEGSHFIVNTDVHYNLGDPDALNFYPLAGLNYTYYSFDIPSYTINGQTFGGGSVSDGGIGFNLGFGSTYSVSDSMKLYGEVKFLSNDYMANDIGASFGILFSL